MRENDATSGVVRGPGEKLWQRIESHFGVDKVSKALDRVAAAREAIAQDARLPMPKIAVHPRGWHTGEGVLFGTNYPTQLPDGSLALLVQLAITLPLLTEDDGLLRRVLCHEFAHNFWCTVRILHGTQHGKFDFAAPKRAPDGLSRAERIDDQAQREVDDTMLPDLHDWFGPWDVEHFLHTEDDALAGVGEAYGRIWLAHNLPAGVPFFLPFQATGRTWFDPRVVAHAYQVEQKRARRSAPSDRR